MGQVPRQGGRRHGNGNAQLCDDALGVRHQLQRRNLSALCRTRGDSRANGHAYARTAAARAGERGPAWSARRRRAGRSDERRGGKEGVGKCRSRWWTYNEKKKIIKKKA